MSVEIWIAPYLASVVLLGIAGTAKVAKPNDTVGALRSVGIRVNPQAVRAGSAAELLVAAFALTTSSPLGPALVAISYAALAGFVVLAWTKDGAISSCGCFGERDTPPTLLHGLLNIAAVICALAMMSSQHGPLQALPSGHLHSAMVLLLSATIAYIAYLSMAVLPQVGARR